MLDISVIILTLNEELHIRRCIENVRSIAKQIFVVDCFSTDRTLEIAKQYNNVIILQNNQSSNMMGLMVGEIIHKPIKICPLITYHIFLIEKILS